MAVQKGTIVSVYDSYKAGNRHNTHDYLQELMRSLKTQRYHNARTINKQTTGEHSAGVAVLISILFPRASTRLLRAALYHDMGELIAGDVPAPVSRLSPVAKAEIAKVEHAYLKFMGLDEELTPEEKEWLKFADLAELCYHLQDEIKLGNRQVSHMYRNGVDYLSDLNYKILNERAEDLLEDLRHFPVP